MMALEKTEDNHGRSEIDYMRGSRAAWLTMLSECLSQLGYDDLEAQKCGWVKEREATVAMLRLICDDHGDNEWADDAHLADVVEKHLARHL
jgi:hypothetical protein